MGSLNKFVTTSESVLSILIQQAFGGLFSFIMQQFAVSVNYIFNFTTRPFRFRPQVIGISCTISKRIFAEALNYIAGRRFYSQILITEINMAKRVCGNLTQTSCKRSKLTAKRQHYAHLCNYLQTSDKITLYILEVPY